MSDQILQCKTCGARVVQTVHPGNEPVACPKCESRNWVEIRGYQTTRVGTENWLQNFLRALEGSGKSVHWR